MLSAWVINPKYLLPRRVSAILVFMIDTLLGTITQPYTIVHLRPGVWL